MLVSFPVNFLELFILIQPINILFSCHCRRAQACKRRRHVKCFLLRKSVKKGKNRIFPGHQENGALGFPARKGDIYFYGLQVKVNLFIKFESLLA